MDKPAKFVIVGDSYNAVCQHIGWEPKIHAVKVREAGEIVEATGTLLKPDEWRRLAGFDGSVMADGRRLKIVEVPSRRL